MWLEHLTRRSSAVAQFAHHVFFLAAAGGAYLASAYQASMSIISQPGTWNLEPAGAYQASMSIISQAIQGSSSCQPGST